MDKNIENKLEKNIHIGKIVLEIILGFSLFIVIYRIFNFNWKPMNALVNVVEDASVFINIICISYMCVAIFAKPISLLLLILGMINIVIINKLYSNKRWLEIWNYVKNVDFRIIIFVVISIILLLFLIYFVKKNINIYRYEIKENSNEDSLACCTKEESGSNEEKETDNEETQNKDTGNLARDSIEPSFSNKKSNLTLFQMILCILGSIITWAIIDYIIYEVLQLEFTRPQSLAWIPNILRFAAIISASVIVVVIAWKIITWILDNLHKTKNHLMHLSAIIAMGLEIILFSFTDQLSSLNVLDDFLSAITNNVFASFLVWVAIFLILHIMIIVLFHFFNKNSEEEVGKVLENRVKKIEKDLVVFVCNIFDGIIGLFYFIPDFFNTIGSLLLDREEQLFPDDRSVDGDTVDNQQKKNT